MDDVEDILNILVLPSLDLLTYRYQIIHAARDGIVFDFPAARGNATEQ
jgi:hypothetical protein